MGKNIHGISKLQWWRYEDHVKFAQYLLPQFFLLHYSVFCLSSVKDYTIQFYLLLFCLIYTHWWDTLVFWPQRKMRRVIQKKVVMKVLRQKWWRRDGLDMQHAWAKRTCPPTHYSVYVFPWKCDTVHTAWVMWHRYTRSSFWRHHTNSTLMNLITH